MTVLRIGRPNHGNGHDRGVNAAADATPDVIGDAAEALRGVVLVGIGLGVLVGGIGGRLAMLALRLTSPDAVRGVTSDDGFEIGRVTLGGTYGLLLIGAVAGLIGAGAYRLVAPWLPGPSWFQNVSAALGAGAVVGSMLVHADGVDFTVLRPAWLAIAYFVAIPALFGAVVGPVLAARVGAAAWIDTGWRRWCVPAAAVVAFPVTLIFVPIVGAGLVIGAGLRASGRSAQLHAQSSLVLAVRAAWLAVVVLGLVVLVGDIGDIAART